jgi:hypothetical protein
MRRLALAFALAPLWLALPASAQQYWLPNGPGGTTWNNPQGSWSGTVYENMLQRRAQELQWQRQRRAAGLPEGGGLPPWNPPGAARQPAAAGAASFVLANRGSLTIREVYVSAATDNSWGADRLGANVLTPGGSLSVRLPPGQCVNDVRVVYMNGRSQERRQVNTCALLTMTFP